MIQAVEKVDFTDGVSKEDYRILAESENCKIESLAANEIDCRPPSRKPAVDSSGSDCHERGMIQVQVRYAELCLTMYVLKNWLQTKILQQYTAECTVIRHYCSIKRLTDGK